MKFSTPLKFTQVIMLFCLASLFYSCDLDTDKLKEGVDSATKELTDIVENTPKSADIGDVDIEFCNTTVDNHHGCYCNFKDASGNGPNIFVSNMDETKSACISINGKTEIVTGIRVDSRQELLKHSYVPDWIVLDPDGDVHLFNELVEDANYEENKKMIVETMLVMNSVPEKIRWRKNKDEDGNEVSDDLATRYEKMWSESLAMVADEKAKGNHGAPLEIELSNEMFIVHLTGNVEKHNDDGSDNYKGTIEVKSKSGKVLGSRDFMGICMCEK